MYKIILKGLAGRTNALNKSILHGVRCEDDFGDYLNGSRYGQQLLIDKGVKNGYMSFKYEDGKLYVIVSWKSKEKLDENEIQVLIRYTQGQMSDGIGEGFEQYPCTYEGGEEIYVSPWYRGQILTATQREIDVMKKDNDIDDKNIKWY
jgi:hypothetical protein